VEGPERDIVPRGDSDGQELPSLSFSLGSDRLDEQSADSAPPTSRGNYQRFYLAATSLGEDADHSYDATTLFGHSKTLLTIPPYVAVEPPIGETPSD
jgi:hypothetical protein